MAFEQVKEFYEGNDGIQEHRVEETARRYYRQWDNDSDLGLSPRFGRNMFESLLMTFELYEEGELDLEDGNWIEDAADSYNEVMEDYLEFRPEKALEYDPVEAVRVSLEPNFDVEYEGEGLRVHSGQQSGKVIPQFLIDTLGIEFPTESVEYFNGESREVSNPVSGRVASYLGNRFNLADQQKGIDNFLDSDWAWYRVSDAGLADEAGVYRDEEVAEYLEEFGISHELQDDAGIVLDDEGSEEIILTTTGEGILVIGPEESSKFMRDRETVRVGNLSNLRAVIDRMAGE